jgi:hypothetical protein
MIQNQKKNPTIRGNFRLNVSNMERNRISMEIKMSNSINALDSTQPKLIEIPATRPEGLDRFGPEPASSTGEVFRSVVGTLSLVAGRFLGSNGAGISENPWDLIQQQLEIQKEMMVVSMYSNIKKSEHETQMAPVRNIRVG